MASEAQIEKEFIDILTMKENQWTYRSDLKTETGLWDNLRRHINRINLARLDGVLLTNSEFDQVKSEFRRLTQTPFLAAEWLRGENGIAQITIERETGTRGRTSLTLFSNKDIAGGISSYEVVNQIVPDTEGRTTRGDVTLLINGLPVIHIELKNEFAKDGYWQAFDQIERYAGVGFFRGIYATVQIFIVSNKTSTKYFARPQSDNNFSPAKNFLFNWREPDNKPVEDLNQFTREVLSIPMAHELISRFTVLVDDKKSQKYLMVLRPYQIHAIKKIMESAYSHKGGFIWHATGSGKTLTSFVATKLLAQSAISVARTVMIVDRRDLDSQTNDEFAKFASEYNTGISSSKVAGNTLIVSNNNRQELINNLVSKKNNNTIIITTIQKLSHAIRDNAEKEVNKFEKLKGEHIVFIVDECHRAVSDQEMKAIRKYFPKSTWIGLTGTPIFDENKKQENGTYARTTFDQYGECLHAYTTKNAMDDKAVLDFQVEYHSLMNEEEENRLYLHKLSQKYPDANPEVKLAALTDMVDKEALIDTSDYENDVYVEAMLKKIFRHQSILDKFRVVNGIPTMSAILTTHSIAQAKRIYHKLIELKSAGMLVTGKPVERYRRLNDPDFPRVAITYSFAEKQDEKNDADKEITEIMSQYNTLFGTTYTDIDLYNQNINRRLARKDAQYQKDGGWLDLVIVVDRLLTGFDAPTIQTLYVDRELHYQKLLQAFSRTNRICSGKNIGMIVTFRKPATMTRNVRETIKLFSNEERDWENLVPKQYAEVKQNILSAYEEFLDANYDLSNDTKDLKKQIHVIKAFQTLCRLETAIKSYEEFEADYEELRCISQTLTDENGHIENLKGEVKKTLENQNIGNVEIDELLEIEFSSDQRATLEEKIDSFYIWQLLRDIRKASNKKRFDEVVKNKPAIIISAYNEVLSSLSDEHEVIDNVARHFEKTITDIITEAASVMKVPVEDLLVSFSEYRKDKDDIPYMNIIIDKSVLTKAEFEAAFHAKFRERRRRLEAYWKAVIEDKLLPLKEELAGFVIDIQAP